VKGTQLPAHHRLAQPRDATRGYDRPVQARDDEQTAGPSPLAAALAAVGDRWTLLVVEALLEGPRRFNELQDEVTGIAPNILSDRLRRLEQEGLAIAQPYSE